MKNIKTEKKDLYLVPFDFTRATEDALKYALNLTRIGGGDIIIAHVANTHDEAYDAEVKLVDKIKKLHDRDHTHVSYEVIIGDLFTDLDKIARLTHSTCIVMGTHGVSGFQKIFGSHAQKMVDHSSSPFILIQEGLDKDHIETIVMPFSFDRESIQVTKLATAIAEKYKATMHLVGFRHSDEWLLRDMKTNETIVKSHLEEHHIKHVTHVLPGVRSYEEELIEYANEVNADLIAASYFVKGFLSYYHSFLDTMMMNKYKIPVLTINAPEVMTLNSQFSFITT
ncbi:MAG: universal stress protein [Crocinitomicaceae bacterium]|nr:universal stress protein [Crocinitomicaceae bacterium]